MGTASEDNFKLGSAETKKRILVETYKQKNYKIAHWMEINYQI